MALTTTDQQLQYTQGLRMQAVEKLIAGGKLPETDEDRAHFVKLLDGIDKQALTIKRIDADNANQADNRDIAIRCAEISSRIARGGNPFRKANGVSLDSTGQLPEITPVDGQMEVGRTSETFTDFINRMEPQG